MGYFWGKLNLYLLIMKYFHFERSIYFPGLGTPSYTSLYTYYSYTEQESLKNILDREKLDIT